MKKQSVILVFMMSMLFAGSGYASCGMHKYTFPVKDAWINEAPPVAKVLAGFMKINNPTDKIQLLLGAESPAFEKVEMHRTVMEGDMAKMVRQESIEIPAQGQVEFAPGNLHLMLINPKQPIKAGDTVMITIKFENGKNSPVEFIVRSIDTARHSHH